MSNRMLALLVLLGCSVAALATLPPSRLDEWHWMGNARYRSTLDNARRVQRNRLEQLASADSLLAAARSPRAVRSRRFPIAVVAADPRVSHDSLRAWARALENEAAAYPGVTDSGAGVVVALVRMDERWWSVDRSVLIDGEGRRQHLLVINTTSRERRPGTITDRSGNRVSTVLRTAALELRFGAPGRRIATWAGMAAGYYWEEPLVNLLLRGTDTSSARRWRSTSMDLASDWRWAVRDQWGTLGYLGLFSCLKGTDEVCTRAAGLAPSIMNRDDPASWVVPAYVGILETRQLLVHLLRTQPPEAFARFWRSPLAPAEAMRQELGIQPAPLVRQLWSERFSAPGEPLPSAANMGVTLGLAIVVVTGSAILARRTRTT